MVCKLLSIAFTDAAIAAEFVSVMAPDEITTSPVSQAIIFESSELTAVKISAEFFSTTFRLLSLSITKAVKVSSDKLYAYVCTLPILFVPSGNVTHQLL